MIKGAYVMRLVQNHFHHSVKEITPRKKYLKKKKFTKEHLMSWREKWWNAQYFPLFYSPDMDDFAMTYGHFMNAQEM